MIHDPDVVPMVDPETFAKESMTSKTYDSTENNIF